MHIRADNDPRYSRKFLIMGLIALGFAVYCLYDGLVGYPSRRVVGFDEFKTDFKTIFADQQKTQTLEQFEAEADEKQRHEWETYIESRGIPSGPAVVTQFIMAAGSALIGLFLLSIPLRSRQMDRNQRRRRRLQLGHRLLLRPGRRPEQAALEEQGHRQGYVSRRQQQQAPVRHRRL
jgi:hypothetical protein